MASGVTPARVKTLIYPFGFPASFGKPWISVASRQQQRVDLLAYSWPEMRRESASLTLLPASVPWLYSLFVALTVPLYWLVAGPANFLWFSDIAMIATLLTVWSRSALLASMLALSVSLIELVWACDFIGAVLAGGRFLGLTGYMFDPQVPLRLRIASGTFHLLLLVLLPWLVWRLGYDRRALPLQCAVAWIVLPLSYWVSTPEQNLNWTHGLGRTVQDLLPAWAYVLALMTAIPLLVYLPTHWLFTRFFPAAPPGRARAAGA